MQLEELIHPNLAHVHQQLAIGAVVLRNYKTILKELMDRIKENTQRLDILFRQSHGWLKACAFNISKDRDTADDLVCELYVYLAEKCNPALWYLNSFNLMYCYSFLKTRFLNRIKVQKRNTTLSDNYDTVDNEYDTDKDERIEISYNEVVAELKGMEYTTKWASSKLAQLYFFTDGMTLEKLSKEIGICKSTGFLHVKKAKKHLKDTLNNPFTIQE
jgi:DNA-directed RNA polymerase specialized sigma24 family protein